MKPRRRIGVHLSGHQVTLVQCVFSATGRKLEHCAQFELPSDSAALRKAVFQSQWKEGSFEASEVVLAISMRSAVVRRLLLPSQDPSELAQMIALQAARQLPVGPEAWATAVEPMDTPSERSTRVALMRVRSAEIEEALQLLGGLSRPARIWLDGWGTVMFLKKQMAASSAIVSAALSDDQQVLGVFDSGVPCLVRTVPSTLQDPIACLEEIPSEAEVFQAKDPDRWESLTLRQHTIRVSDAVEIAPTVALPRHPWPALAAALLDLGAVQHDFLPAHFQQQRRLLSTLRHWAPVAALGLSGFGIVCLGGWVRLREAKATLASVTAAAAASAEQTRELGALEASLHKDANLHDGALAPLLSALARQLPPQVVLDSFDLASGAVSLRGHGPTMADALDLEHRLQGAGIFTRVSLRSSSSNTRSARGAQFWIECTFGKSQEHRHAAS